MSEPSVQKNLIAGEWVGSSNASPNINPSNVADQIGVFASANAEETNAAISAARSALDDWRESSIQARADLLDRVGNDLISRSQEIGSLLSREEGKTLAEGVGETIRAGQIFKFFAQEALRITGDSLQSLRPGIDISITREPVGVIGIITPWNFPIAIPAWKVAPALAFGNTVVLKPAELTPACAHILAQILNEQGCPPGVFNLSMGPGSIVGQAIVDSSDVDAISFTGSVPVGRRLARSAAETMKKVQLEMGGKNPMVVMDDADVATAVEASINGSFFSTGQKCTASSRLIVQNGIHDQFVERMTAAMIDLKVGDALDEKTQIGPVVSLDQLLSNLRYCEIAKEEGASVVGGERLSLENEGFYQQPALFLGATNEMQVSREEIFGPCAAIIKVDDFDEAIAVANDCDFGLSSAICTSSLKFAREFRRQSQSGMVMVNLPTGGVDYHVPFGGRKSSSFGPREQGRHAVEFYTTTKTAYTQA